MHGCFWEKWRWVSGLITGLPHGGSSSHFGMSSVRFFNPNIILILAWNFILVSCKLKTNFVLNWKSQKRVVWGKRLITHLIWCKGERLRPRQSILSCECSSNFSRMEVIIVWSKQEVLAFFQGPKFFNSLDNKVINSQSLSSCKKILKIKLLSKYESRL